MFLLARSEQQACATAPPGRASSRLAGREQRICANATARLRPLANLQGAIMAAEARLRRE